MGCYVNPPTETKENFLRREGKVVTAIEVVTNYNKIRAEGKFPVVLVDNGPFTAAAVAYTEEELAEFLGAPYGTVGPALRDFVQVPIGPVGRSRPTTIYVVDTAKLIPVSGLLREPYKGSLTQAELDAS